MQTNSKTLQVFNILGLLLVLTLNYLANALPVGGRTTGEVAAIYTNLFVPAGYAFSIWGLIYLLLVVFVVLQARGLFHKSTPPPPYVEQIGWWFVLSCLANALWILAWHNLQVIIALLLMLVLLIALINIYLRLDISYPEKKPPLLVRLPFSIYLGWITVATVANVAALLVALNWNGFGISPAVWTVITLGVATLITLIVLWKRRDLPYLLVIIWAFTAILARRNAEGRPEGELIVFSIYLALGLLTAGAVLSWLKRNRV